MADFWIASATSYASHMAVMAAANGTPWAQQVADAAAAEAARVLAVAPAERDQKIANANAERDRIISDANAKLTLDLAAAAAASTLAIANAWAGYPNVHYPSGMASISADTSLDVYAGLAGEGPREWWSRLNNNGYNGDRAYEGFVSGMFHTNAHHDGRSWTQWVGEEIIRPLFGDDNLDALQQGLEASLVVLSIVAVGTAFVVLGPAVFLSAALIGFGAGFATDVAAQWDSGGSIDWGQALTAGAIGAVVSVVTAGIGSGVLSALLTRFPGACTVITMSMRGLSVLGGGWGVYQGAVAISEGRYATGVMSIIGGVASAYGAFKISFCFIAGTGIVLEPLDNSYWIITLVGIGLVGFGTANRRKRRREDEEEEERIIDVCFANAKSTDDGPEDDDAALDSVVANRMRELSPDELDSLCDKLFSEDDDRFGDEGFVDSPSTFGSATFKHHASRTGEGKPQLLLDSPRGTEEGRPQEVCMARAMTATKTRTSKDHCPRSNLGHWWLALCLLAAACVGVFAPTLHTKPIEKVVVGDRVAGYNPLREQVDEHLPEPDPKTWKKVDLRMTKADGKRLDIVFLWSPEMMAASGAAVGGTVQLDLPEMGAEGEATVLAVDPCPPIKTGSGNIVTGTFAHEASEGCVNVLVVGASEPIGATANHPFWSEDRKDFVPAGQLRAGESVWTRNSGIKSVLGVTPLAGRPRVYNLQVHSEHVYEVSNLGVLVHNAYDMHHGTPRQVIRNAPPHISRPRIMGTRGRPNRVAVDNFDHRAAHNGWTGQPRYNEEFQRRLDSIDRTRRLTEADYWDVRVRMLWEYFGI